MNPAVAGVLDFAMKVAVLLGLLGGALKFFGAPLLAKTIRTALAPELEKWAEVETALAKLREEHDLLSQGTLTRRADLDRRIGSHEAALGQLPAMRATLDHLSSEMGRSNALNDRQMAAMTELAVQVGRLQGAFEAVSKAAG